MMQNKSKQKKLMFVRKKNLPTKSERIVFGSVIAGAFQIAFRAEMCANDVFYFLKIIFDISTSKRSKKYKPHSILEKKNQI